MKSSKSVSILDVLYDLQQPSSQQSSPSTSPVNINSVYNNDIEQYQHQQQPTINKYRSPSFSLHSYDNNNTNNNNGNHMNGNHVNGNNSPGADMKRSKSTPFLNPQYQMYNNNNQNNQNINVLNHNNNQNSFIPYNHNVPSTTSLPIGNTLYKSPAMTSSISSLRLNYNSDLSRDEIINRLELQIQSILIEVEQLKKRIIELEAEQGRHAWGLKYSRRVLITSNFLLGIWVSISRIVMYISKQKKMRLLHVVTIGAQESRNRVLLLLLEAISNAARKSWIFFLSSFLLSRNTPWKRQSALVACTTYSLYLAFFPQYLPWTNYFNVFACLLYVTAAWSTSKSGDLKDIFKLL